MLPCMYFTMAISVDTIPNRNSPPAILLREAWREGTRIRRRTLANLSKLPPPMIDAIRALTRGGIVFKNLEDAVTITRALPHGHVAAILGLCRKLGMKRLLHRTAGRMRELALAAMVARILDPGSKLACARALSADTASSSLGSVLGLGTVSGNEMLSMLDWLRARQPWIERGLARRHLGADNTLILYDVSSSYLEGRSCPLAAFGYNRDGKRGKKQITFGLLCARNGCPVAIEVFSGNTADPNTVASRVQVIRERFGIARVALVGDRGMISTARIRSDLAPADLDWISALKTSDIRKLLKSSGRDGEGNPSAAVLRPEQLVPDTVAQISSPDFPGERLLVCLNPRLRSERARRRESLLQATEEILEEIARSVRRTGSRLRGRDRINHRVGREVNRRKMAKHFDITVTDDDLEWTRNTRRITEEARLDGIYVVRTSLDTDAIGADEAVEAYKSLSQVEQAFRAMKLTRLEVRPVYVYNAERVRAHVFLCMLAWYVEWHLRRQLAPLLFEDDDRAAARARRRSPVQGAEGSERAKTKAATKLTDDGFTVHSMKTLLADLATLTLNEVTLPASPDHAIRIVAQPTPQQKKTFELLEIDPLENVAM